MYSINILCHIFLGDIFHFLLEMYVPDQVKEAQNCEVEEKWNLKIKIICKCIPPGLMFQFHLQIHILKNWHSGSVFLYQTAKTGWGESVNTNF